VSFNLIVKPVESTQINAHVIWLDGLNGCLVLELKKEENAYYELAPD
jgi:hypothetical protein